MLKVSPNIANELLNRYRSNLDQLERKFSNKIMTFIDPYKQNDNYTIEIKKNAYFDYEYELEESSKAFQNRTTYNVKVPKKTKKALVEDVEFRNIPKVDSNKKGLLDSLFNFFKGEEKTKPKRKKFSDRRARSGSNRKSRQNRSTNKNFRGNKKFNPNEKVAKNVKKTPSQTKKTVKDSTFKKPIKPKSGNVKLTPEPTPKPVDDNIGNRIEPVKKKTVRRAKNDPRA